MVENMFYEKLEANTFWKDTCSSYLAYTIHSHSCLSSSSFSFFQVQLSLKNPWHNPQFLPSYETQPTNACINCCVKSKSPKSKTFLQGPAIMPQNGGTSQLSRTLYLLLKTQHLHLVVILIHRVVREGNSQCSPFHAY